MRKPQKVSEICTEELSKITESGFIQLDSEKRKQLHLLSSNTEWKADSTTDLLSTTCDRFGKSNMPEAAIGSAFLQASNSQIVNKTKLHRKKKGKYMILQILGLYSEGRKDQTSVISKKKRKNIGDAYLLV